MSTMSLVVSVQEHPHLQIMFSRSCSQMTTALMIYETEGAHVMIIRRIIILAKCCLVSYLFRFASPLAVMKARSKRDDVMQEASKMTSFRSSTTAESNRKSISSDSPGCT